MLKTASLLLTGALLASAAPAPKTYTGIITDTMCGADHAAMKVTPNAKCVRDCVKPDKANKYALLDGKNVYVLSDQQTPEKYAAQKVKVTGTLYEKTKILKVDSIEPLGPAAADSAQGGSAEHSMSGHMHSH